MKFPHEEAGKQCKLSRPWHGPFCVLARNDPDLTVAKVYPQDGQIQVYQLWVSPCPTEFPAGYYWYGKKKQSPGCPAKWLNSCCPHHLHSVRYVENSNQKKSPPVSPNMMRSQMMKQTTRSLTMREPMMKQKVDHQIHQNHSQPNVWTTVDTPYEPKSIPHIVTHEVAQVELQLGGR